MQPALTFEINRKIFHLASLVFPISYYLVGKLPMIIILLIISGFTLYIDISRHYNRKIKGFVEKFFTKFIRPDEKSGSFRLSGASYMALGFLLSCLLLPKNLAITTWLVLILADCSSALVGMKYGKRLSNGKSIVGFWTFVSTAILISILTYFAIGYNTSFMVIIISSFAAAAAEFYSKNINIDDNLSIPLAYGLTTIICNLLLT